MKPACKSSPRALCCEQAMRGHKAKPSWVTNDMLSIKLQVLSPSLLIGIMFPGTGARCMLHLQKKSRTSRNELPTQLASWQCVFKAVAVPKAVILWIFRDKWNQSPLSCFQMFLPVTIIFFRYTRIQLSALSLPRPTVLVIGRKCFPSHS